MRLILHIGHPKTASSSIQAALFANRGAFAAQGVAFPTDFRRAGGGDAAGQLRQGEVTAGNAAILSGYRGGGAGFYADRTRRARFWEAVRAAAGHTAILSSEVMFYLKPDRLAVLAGDIAEAGFEPEILAWIARQDVMLLRVWAQNVRANGIAMEPAAYLDSRPARFMDYDRVLSAWAAAFGAARVRARLFDRDRMVGGDVWQDFMAAAGLAAPPGAVAAPRTNESLPPGWIEAARRLNRLRLPGVARGVRLAERLVRPEGSGAALRRRWLTGELCDRIGARYAGANARLVAAPYLAGPPAVLDAYWRFPGVDGRA